MGHVALIKPEFIDTQWSGVIPALYAGRFDMVPTMSYTKERLEKVLFPIPYADASQALLIRNGDKDKIKGIADMTGRVMTHLAQSRLEVEQVMRRDGMTPAEVVDDVGMLHDHLIAAHCIFMTPSDIARAGKAGITVAHAPKVNLTGGCLPVTSALRRAGAQIARHGQHARRHDRADAVGAGGRPLAGPGRDRRIALSRRLPHGDPWCGALDGPRA